jgi:protein SHQ1
VDWYLDAHQFKFFVKPYFLRLTFEQELVEDGRETAQYDIETGRFTKLIQAALARSSDLT